MRKIFPLLTLTLLFAMTNSFCRSFEILPTTGDPHWKIIERTGIVSDDWTPVPIADPEGATILINEPGNYQIIEDSVGKIVIDASDVHLILNDYMLTWSNAHETIITIAANNRGVQITGGRLYNESGPGQGCGILVSNGCSGIYIENVQIQSCGCGIWLSGQFGSNIKNCNISDCSFFENDTGLFLQYADKNKIHNCGCTNGIEYGFELQYSTNNRITDCYAIGTHNIDGSAIGFASTNGQCNLFKDCVAKKTITEATEYCNKSYGFLLTGTEKKTKILDCVVNETKAIEQCAVGICLKPNLLEGEDLLATVTINENPGADVRAIGWSPCERFLVNGDDNDILRVYKFDGSYLVEIDNKDLLSDINGVAWSPDSKKITAVTEGGFVYIFEFDGQSLTETISKDESGALQSVDWSPCGNHIVLGRNEGSGDTVLVYKVEETSLTAAGSADDASGNSGISWSSCGNYIAVSDSLFGQNVYVYQLIDNSLDLIANITLSGATSFFVRWAPCGKYIAVAQRATGLTILKFEGLNDLTVVDELTTESADKRCSWSPCGKYIVLGMFLSNTEINIVKFENDELSFIKSLDLPNSIYSIDWSPTGRFIATGGADDLIRIFSAMNTPENCLVKNNSVCDSCANGPTCAYGIFGHNEVNAIINNVCSNNEVDFSFGITNVYSTLTTYSINLTDNLSCCCGCCGCNNCDPVIYV